MRRRLLVAGTVLVLIAAGLIGRVKIISPANAASARSQTATVTRGALAATISAAGNVTAPGTVALAFASSGQVTLAPFAVGDQVKKGQLVMQQDTTALTLALKTAQTTLANQQATLESTRTTLDYAVKSAQATLAGAQANYDSAKITNSTNSNQLIVAQATLDKAWVALQTAQSNYNAVAWRPDIGMTTQAAALQSATSDYNSALATYKITVAGINDTALQTAKATLDSARAALDQAQKNLDTSMRAAQASLDSASLAVDQAQRNLDNASLYAPFDGVISSVNFAAGDTASGTAVSIVDPSNLQVSLTVAEVDMAKLKLGQTAEMTLDAISGKTYTTTVTAIGPVGTVTSGVVTYPVIVSIVNADSDIKPGMTANLAVQVDHRDNVLLIPLRAVSTKNSQKVVSVLRQGKTVQTVISTGLANDTMTEVTNGLSEGDVVLLNTTSTAQTNSGGGIPLLGGPAGGPPA